MNARDRIGTGPWTNAAGRVIANNTPIALDETGNPVPIAPMNVHDILTGSPTDGTGAANAHCNNWTSSATNMVAQVGHTNRAGNGDHEHADGDHTERRLPPRAARPTTI